MLLANFGMLNPGSTVNRELTLSVLLALDEKQLSLSIESALKSIGFTTFTAADSHRAMQLINQQKPDFIILDRKIPGIGGIRLCRAIRLDLNMAETGIIMLGNSQDISDRILALDVGSDDYLVKPFDMEELLAKISALKRRHPASRLKHVLKAGDIEMVPEQWVVYVAGAPIHLTEKEYRLLQELLEVKGRVLSRETLLERIWGHQTAFTLETRTVDVHISRLRHKLGTTAAGNIITVRNVGYRINVSPEWFKR